MVKGRVLEVDAKRERIGLTMRLSDTPPAAGGKPETKGNRNDAKRLSQHQRQDKPAPAAGAMAAAFAKLKS